MEGQPNVEETPNGCESESCSNSAERSLPDQAQVDALIRKRVYAAIGIGFVPVPLIDMAGLAALQLEMIHALCKAYGIPFKAQNVKSVISALCGGALSVVGAPLLSSVAKFIPVVGYTASATAGCISGAATTYALGCVFDRHFQQGGTLGDIRTENAKEYFSTKVEEGKAVARKFLKQKKNEQTEATPETTA